MKHVLTIAGSDSSGGAGIQADIKTFAAHGVYGMSVITAVTAQNTLGITCVENISPETISRQMEAIFTDITVHAVKIGMVSNDLSIRAVAAQLKRFHPKHIILDTVMVSKSGYPLLRQNSVGLLIRELFPLATLVTPNIPEAELITGIPIHSMADMEKAAAMMYEKGPANVLLKGGHALFDPTDVLFDGTHYHHFTGNRVQTKNTHGTGCTLSAAIAANLANNHTLQAAVAKAKIYITACIEHALTIGRGVGPLNHFWSLFPNPAKPDA
ncbi:MAG: bifunctional hydroxymethylpyrimidine kinase/phosphomethylpyrimidine kinase [Desulfobacterales bacterium]|jgi:hydroxymethylpyrimidine/phosphomethylpyrimidine kinase|nr:bifunctional hydroxymethylpyrimidine kinase/phosphomethylpyrimidine kinase [Desulfobacterales bacterium]